MSESRENHTQVPSRETLHAPEPGHESKGMPAQDSDTLGRAVHEAAKIDADQLALNEAYRQARKKALELLFYANEHIRHPCGGSPEEQAYQRKIHQQAVNEALLEPGIINAMTDDEVRQLNGLLRLK